MRDERQEDDFFERQAALEFSDLLDKAREHGVDVAAVRDAAVKAYRDVRGGKRNPDAAGSRFLVDTGFLSERDCEAGFLRTAISAATKAAIPKDDEDR